MLSYDFPLQVPIAGAYRLIDVPMSNCINSGINKVYILTQFNSASLNRHLARAYNYSGGVTFGDGFVEVRFLHLKHVPQELSGSYIHNYIPKAKYDLRFQLHIRFLQPPKRQGWQVKIGFKGQQMPYDNSTGSLRYTRNLI